MEYKTSLKIDKYLSGTFDVYDTIDIREDFAKLADDCIIFIEEARKKNAKLRRLSTQCYPD